MTKLEDITKAIEQLPPDELKRFRAWFEEMQARLWDEEIEHDITARKLDWLAEEAITEHKAGTTKKLSD